MIIQILWLFCGFHASHEDQTLKVIILTAFQFIPSNVANYENLLIHFCHLHV